MSAETSDRLLRAVEVDGERVEYAVNRCGSDGEWTAESEKHMADLITAVIRQRRQIAPAVPSRDAGGADR